MSEANPTLDPIGYRCDGCGRLFRDPYADLSAIRAAGGRSCCPERKPVGLSDRIEELEAERDDYANKLMQANDTYTEMHLEIELLKAKLAEYQMVASAIDNQWADGEDENADLKAKLAKAVKCLQSLIIEYDKVDLAYDEPKSMTAVYGLALDTLAELTSSVAADDEVKGDKDE